MDGQDFLRIIDEYLNPFLETMGFSMEPPLISGRFYLVKFTGLNYRISVSFEPGEKENLFIDVFKRENDQWSDIDDPSKTPRLADLNRRFMPIITHEEYKENELFFMPMLSKDKDEQHLLKAIKELRLVLPKYISS